MLKRINALLSKMIMCYLYISNVMYISKGSELLFSILISCYSYRIKLLQMTIYDIILDMSFKSFSQSFFVADIKVIDTFRMWGYIFYSRRLANANYTWQLFCDIFQEFSKQFDIYVYHGPRRADTFSSSKCDIWG